MYICTYIYTHMFPPPFREHARDRIGHFDLLCVVLCLLFLVVAVCICVLLWFLLCAWPACERQWSQQQLSAAWFQCIRHSMHLEDFLGMRIPKLSVVFVVCCCVGSVAAARNIDQAIVYMYVYIYIYIYIYIEREREKYI